MNITHIRAREIYNSRGWPTVCCEIVLSDGWIAVAMVPSGLSRGSHEAVVRLDGGNRLWGRGMREAVASIEQFIAPQFVGKEPHAIKMDMQLLELDGTPDKSNLGANTLLAVSMALYRAHAHVENVELFEFIGHVTGAETVSIPNPLFNMINGGLHAQSNLVIQEFLVAPVNTDDFCSAMEAGAVIFHELGLMLQHYGKMLVVGDEGGYASSFANDMQALDILSETLARVKNNYGIEARCALDVAASRLYEPTTKLYSWDGKKMTAEELVTFYADLVSKYPIISIEDGLHEDDWSGWQLMTSMLGDRIAIVGDDLFTTHPKRILQGEEKQAANAVIIKPDQIGTVTETLQTIQLCRELTFVPIASHRSGETEDTFIADLAVGTSLGQIKAGGLQRSERLAKYNRLLTIEDRLRRAY